jgi:hypothetical protein
MVHNSKALLKSLEQFILDNVTGHRSAFEVSGVKQDGTVFVRFRSSPVESSLQLAFNFIHALNNRNAQFVQTDDCKFRLALDQF